MKKKIKVLHVVGHLGNGGDTASIKNVNEYIKGNNKNIEFCYLTHKGYNKDYVKKLKEENSEIYILENDARKMGLFKYIKDFKRAINDSQPDIIHFHTAFQSALGILISKKMKIKKIVCHAHITKIQRNTNIIGRKVIIPICRFIINKFSDSKIACSKTAGNFLYGNNSKFNVIYNGINTKIKNLIEEKSINQIKKKYNLTDKIVLGHVGRFDDNKNQIFSIELLKHLDSEKYVLFLIGTGDKEEELKQVVKENDLNNIYFTGFINNVNDYMKMFDVLLLPSKYGEGLPMVLIEEQITNSNCLCLTSNIVTEESNLGNVKFLELNLEKWINAIMNKESLIGKINERKTNYFDINITSKKWLECYKLGE